MLNRLIIVGNGFDLAHGMKTDYCSFMLSFIKEWFREATSSATKTADRGYGYVKSQISNYDISSWNSFEDFKIWIVQNRNVSNYIYPSPHHIQYKFTWYIDAFLSFIILKFCDLEWVDIENAYYEHLKQIRIINDRERKIANLSSINKVMEDLRN